MWVVTTFDPQDDLLGVPAGSEGADSAGAIQSQGLQQPIQAAELAVDDLPANGTQRHELQHLCPFYLKRPSICFYFNSKIFFIRKNTQNIENIEIFVMKSSIQDLDYNSDSLKLGLCCKYDTITSYEPVHLWNVPNRCHSRFPQLYLFTLLLMSNL